jgi:hypothetical protein
MAMRMTDVPARPALEAERWFFVYMALACVAIAFAGFISRYFAPVAAGRFDAPSLVHIHGLVMWSWTLLFAWQTWLAASGKLQRHRSFGMAGIALFTLAVWIGASVSLQQLDRQLDAGIGNPARAFLAMPMSLALMMVVLFAAAILNARRSDVHARLMLLATLVALTPALARLTGDAFGTGPHPRNPIIGGFVALALVGVAVARDLRVHGRPHAAYLYGGGFIAAGMLARSTLNRTEAWYAVADGLRALVH